MRIGQSCRPLLAGLSAAGAVGVLGWSRYMHSPLADPARVPLRSDDALRALGSVVVVAPHPDDETLGCGGLIARLTALGQAVHVLILTDGTGSHPNSKRFPPEQLKHLREGEARAALRALGQPETALSFLGLPDRRLPDTDQPGFDEAVCRVAAELAAHLPGAVFVTWRRDPHRDHRAAFEITAEACAQLAPAPRLIEYPIWVWHGWNAFDRPRADEVSAWRLDITDELPAKRKAILAHRSQTSPFIDDDPHGSHLSEQQLVPFRQPWELFFEARAAAG